MSIATLEAPFSTIRIIPLSATPRATSTPPLSTQCSTCHLRDLCLPRDLPGEDVQQLDRLSFGRRRVGIGQALYRAGDRFQFVYAVRSGTFKISLGLADGREQVSGFHMTGELMGLDGVANGFHASTATALEDAEICSISYVHLSEQSARSGSLQSVVGRLMSREIVREHSLMMLLSLVHYIDVQAFPNAFGYGDPVILSAQRYAESFLAEQKSRLEESGVQVDTKLCLAIDKRLGQCISDAARAWGADLIVLGSHGRRGIGRVLLGSGAEQIIREAPVPALVIPGGI
jgi:CRP-like cAMP-binding protein